MKYPDGSSGTQQKPLAATALYKQNVYRYAPADALLALGLYLLLVVVYFLGGRYLMNMGRWLGIGADLLSVLLCFTAVKIRRQDFSSIGFTSCNIARDIIAGILLGLAAAMINLVPAILGQGVFIGFNRLAVQALYFFIVIALSEEILFRGYIQTRLYGLVKNDVFAVILGGLLFSLLHIPYQMQRRGLSLPVFLQQYYPMLITTFVAHIFLNISFRKTNSLIVPVLVHGFLNFGGSLFI